ncbi:MAG: RHS repeat-associated core domain-containing protein, partial [Planctomycetes bacterium]|nr:RHS repeat-associated core domain-containing protein [Planctomycetota bacterium]
VSSTEDCHFLEFWLDGELQDAISGDVEWQQKTYTISGSGTHTLRWRYFKNSDGSTGAACGWLDRVQWLVPTQSEPPSNAWRQLAYVYDASGRRIEKRYDGATILQYIYDGDHCIAEYDAGGNLKRKYLYGPGVDQPICMIENPQSDPNYYYYHFDALGSVVALTNSSGNTVQVYEYDVYGRVGATDASHPNRILFTGREFDKETGLYYYRARYYDPQIGRFLQTDPIGYGDGMNLYAYCGNSPLGLTDPTGQWASYTFQWVETGGGPRLGVQCLNADGSVGTDFYFGGWSDLFDYVNGGGPRYSAPGDFCDGNFDSATFWASIDAAQAADPTYGPNSRRIPSGDFQSSFDNAVDSAMSALPSDETLYTIGDTSTAVGTGIILAVVTSGAATPALAPGGLLATGAAAGTTAAVATAGRVGTHARVAAAASGTGLQAHHIIPVRFAGLFNTNSSQMMAVALDPKTHQMFTSAWRDAIGQSNSLNPLNTNTATAADVLRIAGEIYRNHPQLLKAIGL